MSIQHSALRAAVYIPLLLLILLSLPFIVSDLDLRLEEPFYNHTTDHWEVGDGPLWRSLYVAGPVPAILLSIIAGIVFVLGLGNLRLAKFRKLGAYFFAVLLIGSGLITNVILKDNWGRPRPAQLEVFDGTEDFERLLHIDPASDGKSFPCGHATIGFFFLALVPILRGRRRWAALLIALVFGGLVGVARMVQGGHFASDVIWAAAVMWFTSLLFYRLLHLDKGLWWSPPAGFKPPPRWLSWALGMALVVLIGLAMTIWPYDKTIHILSADSEAAQISDNELSLDFQGEDILEIRDGPFLSIESKTDGHRAPKSKLRGEANRDGNLLRVTFKKTGLFSELNVRTVVTVPPKVKLNIITGDQVSLLLLPEHPAFEVGNLKLPPSTQTKRKPK